MNEAVLREVAAVVTRARNSVVGTPPAEFYTWMHGRYIVPLLEMRERFGTVTFDAFLEGEPEPSGLSRDQQRDVARNASRWFVFMEALVQEVSETGYDAATALYMTCATRVLSGDGESIGAPPKRRKALPMLKPLQATAIRAGLAQVDRRLAALAPELISLFRNANAVALPSPGGTGAMARVVSDYLSEMGQKHIVDAVLGEQVGGAATTGGVPLQTAILLIAAWAGLRRQAGVIGAPLVALVVMAFSEERKGAGALKQTVEMLALVLTLVLLLRLEWGDDDDAYVELDDGNDVEVYVNATYKGQCSRARATELWQEYTFVGGAFEGKVLDLYKMDSAHKALVTALMALGGLGTLTNILHAAKK